MFFMLILLDKCMQYTKEFYNWVKTDMYENSETIVPK